MSLKLKVPPAKTPVTLGEVKEFCHIDFPDNDNKLTRLINAAVALLDGYDGIMGRALISQQWELTYDTFPSQNLLVPIGNLISVDLVEYVDPTSLIYTTWPVLNNYETDLIANDYGWVIPSNGWPSIADTFNAARVTFTAGFGSNPTDVPEAIRTAICMLVDCWNEGAATPDNGIPKVVSSLLAPFRRRAEF